MSYMKINQLTKTYKSGRGAFDIDLSIESGQVLALLGPNGAGKTTIMKAATGLIMMDHGTVTIGGQDIKESYELSMKQTGTLIGKVASYEYMTAFQNLKIKANYLGLADEEIDHVLSLVGLLTYKDEKTRVFSTGMKQRLGIASALLGNPKVLILDEPLSGMDIDGKRTVRQLLQDLVENQQKTILISSHMIHEIESVYTNLAIIQDGRIIAQATKDQLRQEGLLLEEYYANVVDEYRRKSPVETISRRKIG